MNPKVHIGSDLLDISPADVMRIQEDAFSMLVLGGPYRVSTLLNLLFIIK